jgi:hypothetical protein
LQEGDELSERSGTVADDPFSGRHPTIHERLTGQPWDASYHDGPAPWDVGQPQPDPDFSLATGNLVRISVEGIDVQESPVVEVGVAR